MGLNGGGLGIAWKDQETIVQIVIGDCCAGEITEIVGAAANTVDEHCN